MTLLTIKQVQQMLLELMVKVDTFLREREIPYYMLGGSALGAVRHEGFIPWDDDIDIGMLRADYERFLRIADEFDKEYDVVNFKRNNNCDYCLTRIYIPNTFMYVPELAATKLDKRVYFDIFPIDNVPEDDDERNEYEKQIVKRKKMIARIDPRNNKNSGLFMAAKKIVSFFLRPNRQRIIAKTDALMRKYENDRTKYVCSLSSQYSFAKQVMPREVYGTPVDYAFEGYKFSIPEKYDTYLTTLFGGDYMQVPPEHKRRKGHDIYTLN